MIVCDGLSPFIGNAPTQFLLSLMEYSIQRGLVGGGGLLTNIVLGHANCKGSTQPFVN